jgi:ATP-binding cassette subfamily B protein
VKGKFDKARRQLSNIPRAVRMVWRAAPGWTTLWAVLILAQGLLPVATVYLTKALVDSLTLAIGQTDDPGRFNTALFYLAAMAAVLLATAAFKSIAQWVQTAQSEIVQDYIKDKVHQQAIRLDLAYFESPGYYDKLHRATIDAITKPLTLIQSLGLIAQSCITLIAMIGILATLSLWLPIILFVSSLPALYVAINYSIKHHRLQMWRTEKFRLANYYSTKLTERESAAEVRLFGLGQYFRSRYSKIRVSLRDEQIALSKRQGIAELLAALSGLAAMGITIAWTAASIIRSGGSLGDLAMIYQAFNQGQKLMQALLNNIKQLYTSMLFIENLFAFLELSPQLPEPELPATRPVVLKQGIKLENVSFRYPGSEHYSLQDFNLEIPAGKVIAIVGENGAGKSTLIKLLTRLYDPAEGKVYIDGVDARDLPLDQLRRLFTVMFQIPVQYQQTVSDNISIGDWKNASTPADVINAAQGAGANIPIQKLPNQYETLLGKLFGGSELSGGEWQRIALARAFLRNAPVIILDEPTSAMDSWAEADWMDRFRDLTSGRTALIITHRFTTAMRADLIHVMSDGKIIESGTHQNLLLQQGRYNASWTRQTEQNRSVY